ncbi:MAG TPA: hypothetical protein VGK54_17700 [Chloroflexota bacterium]
MPTPNASENTQHPCDDPPSSPIQRAVRSAGSSFALAAALARIDDWGIWQWLLPLDPGETVELVVASAQAAADLEIWCDLSGNELIRAAVEGHSTRLVLRKGGTNQLNQRAERARDAGPSLRQVPAVEREC